VGAGVLAGAAAAAAVGAEVEELWCVVAATMPSRTTKAPSVTRSANAVGCLRGHGRRGGGPGGCQVGPGRPLGGVVVVVVSSSRLAADQVAQCRPEPGEGRSSGRAVRGRRRARRPDPVVVVSMVGHGGGLLDRR
jgi:hypothetical protein